MTLAAVYVCLCVCLHVSAVWLHLSVCVCCATRRVVRVCDLEVAPPSLDAIVIHAAVRLLPHYLPDTSTPLRQQPLVQKALQLTSLLMAVGATDGHSPWVAAGEVLRW